MRRDSFVMVRPSAMHFMFTRKIVIGQDSRTTIDLQVMYSNSCLSTASQTKMGNHCANAHASCHGTPIWDLYYLRLSTTFHHRNASKLQSQCQSKQPGALSMIEVSTFILISIRSLRHGAWCIISRSSRITECLKRLNDEVSVLFRGSVDCIRIKQVPQAGFPRALASTTTMNQATAGHYFSIVPSIGLASQSCHQSA